MKYNVKGLNRLVESLGMQFEIERLMFAGLTYEGLAEAFDDVFNPDSPNCSESVRFFWFRRTTEKFRKYGRIGYRMSSKYFGIDTIKYHTLESVAKPEGLTKERVRQYLDKIRKYGHWCNVNSNPSGFGILKRQIYQTALDKVLANS